jgi:hypothetical protein
MNAYLIQTSEAETHVNHIYDQPVPQREYYASL